MVAGVIRIVMGVGARGGVARRVGRAAAAGIIVTRIHIRRGSFGWLEQVCDLHSIKTRVLVHTSKLDFFLRLFFAACSFGYLCFVLY